AEAYGIQRRDWAEEIRAGLFEAFELRGRVAALPHDFECSSGLVEEPEMGFGSTDIAGQDEAIHRNPDPVLAFDVERLGERDFLGAADINRMALVDRGGSDVENPPFTGRTAPAALFREHRERCELVHQAQFPFGLAAFRNLGGIHKYSALEQASMEIGGECP